MGQYSTLSSKNSPAAIDNRTEGAPKSKRRWRNPVQAQRIAGLIAGKDGAQVLLSQVPADQFAQDVAIIGGHLRS